MKLYIKIIILLLITSSCVSTYKIRHNQAVILQREIREEHSTPACKDRNRTERNQSLRPSCSRMNYCILKNILK